jgi:serine/threonine protein kinase
MKKSLQKTISKKYEILGYLGKGSYGCVSKARCRETGRLVALKTMKNAQLTEYELIKLLREILLMKKFNQILDQVDPERGNESYPFVLELIDIITPESVGPMPDLSQVCLVSEYFNSDLD